MTMRAPWHFNGAGAIKLTDGTPTTPLEHTIKFDDGSFSVGPLPELLQEEVEVISRGNIVGVVPGAPIFPEGSATVQVSEFSDTSAGTLLDFMYALADTPYELRKSTITDDYFVHCNLEYSNGTDTLELTDCRVTITQYTEGDPSTLALSFRCRGEVFLNGVRICRRLNSTP